MKIQATPIAFHLSLAEAQTLLTIIRAENRKIDEGTSSWVNRSPEEAFVGELNHQLTDAITARAS